MPQFPPSAAGKNGKFRAPRPDFQTLVRDEPPFPRNVSRTGLRSPVEFLEARFHYFIGNSGAERRDPVRRQSPIVVIAGAILPPVDFGIADALPSKKMNRLDNRLVK